MSKTLDDAIANVERLEGYVKTQALNSHVTGYSIGSVTSIPVSVLTPQDELLLAVARAVREIKATLSKQ